MNVWTRINMQLSNLFWNGWLCHEYARYLLSHPKLIIAFFPDLLHSHKGTKVWGHPKELSNDHYWNEWCNRTLVNFFQKVFAMHKVRTKYFCTMDRVFCLEPLFLERKKNVRPCFNKRSSRSLFTCHQDERFDFRVFTFA